MAIEEIRVKKTIPFDYLQKGLEMSFDQVERLKDIQLRGLQSRRKLCLVLDLDHTLLHTNFRQNPNINAASHDDIFEWKAMGKVYFTKLRPFVRNFLEEASHMFTLYVYTMGSRNYAHIVTDFLDPQGVYFGKRVISREDCTTPGQKGLDVVPVDPSAVVVLDDTEPVWKGYFANLLLIEKYDYFSQMELDESEDQGGLSYALEVLTKLHSVYFDWYDNFMDCDVRELLDTRWEEIIDDQGVGMGTCASEMRCGKRERRVMVDDDCSSVTKKQRIC
ncbi:RNA polymerase II C-terminal domain phosphatase-like [Heracleum sosnowskyi]|uniref:RNA polymerase II C-terminal domain phosphatase-like n=1 Tax=Heracleum sosnowskyi TaxID=360622 RepID=A0AAD8IYK1_9APIA|nr:RNA polymerase II C-terminal domain phosphatase-like [Heracleum sosnowskyi]